MAVEDTNYCYLLVNCYFIQYCTGQYLDVSMKLDNLQTIFEEQTQSFRSGVTRPVSFRIAQLRRLRRLVSIHQKDICESIGQDLGKSYQEAFITEIATVLHEIDYHVRNIKRWTRLKKVSSSLFTFPSSGSVEYEPLGTSLIIGSWNYPFHLLFMPLVGAISAGNTVVLKPSEMAPNTADLLTNLINKTFERDQVFSVNGGIEVSQELLRLPFRKIFFTGSSKVGRIVMKAAADHLSQVTLELGGKSPAVILSDARLDVAVRRIWWGKCINAGQTCVAPDYVLIHESLLDEFLSMSKKVLKELYPNGYGSGNGFARIVSTGHFQRLESMVDGLEPVLGGNRNEETLLFEPMVVLNPSIDHPIMTQEIFGPILPVITFKDVEQALALIEHNPDPLALYLFTREKAMMDEISKYVSFGGGCLNDTITHLGNPNLPFGGIGASGMGNYHGFYSFRTFSRERSILAKSTWPDPSLRYPPYGKIVDFLKRLLLR